MPDEYAAPKHIDEFYKKKEMADKILATRIHHREKAYRDAVEKNIMGDDKLVHHKWLNDKKVADKFADTMATFYLEKAKEDLGIKDIRGKDSAERSLRANMLLKSYYGHTKDDLQNLVRQHGEGFTHDVYKKAWKRHHYQISEDLEESVGAHLKDEHIEDILKYIKTDKGSALEHLSAKTTQVRQAVELLKLYDKGRSILSVEGLSKLPSYKGKKKEYKAPEKAREGKVIPFPVKKSSSENEEEKKAA